MFAKALSLKKHLLPLIGGLFYFWGTSAWAEGNSAVSRPSYPGSDPLSFSAFLQLALGLLLVLGVIFFLAWLLKRMSFLPGQHPQLRILAAIPLSHRERAVLIQVGDEQLLLGVAPGQVNLLKSFDQPILTTDIASTSDFSKRLQRLLNSKSDVPS
ncbi:flagellar biosynthetic protein FliO [Nitrincola tapanii]|uniref:Flagellar protein n=1 Tax=Nitrincola tapanii TaxID=1708751 RepID=A0A5A9W747_9GAMM|nr:flagellar biosynthetic protein FliO [Nitrincola tapanii]KAA0876620.1 flagellar biosynthetic protein FliO [Nitrincola tapanii]